MLKAQKWDAVRMAHSAESFYTSLGFPPLPKTFWERSMLTRPRDREVVCHASAWDMAAGADVRVKACLEPTEEDLYTIYHELGHDYYFLSYATQPYLFRDGANDGFHEAIGDTINLSVTPAYLARIGLVHAVKPSREALINQQMKMALEKIAFLPFGRLIDQWRWKVFSGEITPCELQRQLVGAAPPLPGHRAAGAAHGSRLRPGREVPHPGQHARTRVTSSRSSCSSSSTRRCARPPATRRRCTSAPTSTARRRVRAFQAMLAQGAAAPWQDTLEKLTGTRQIDASAITEYFQPLMQWLSEENKGQQCGW